MKILSRTLFVGIALVFLPPAFGEGEEEWKASTLKDETLQKVQTALVGYQQCVNDETRLHINDKLDSRAVTDSVLKKCEEKLGAVKTAFDGENVPASVSERYMRSRRTHAARNILKTVMGIQALRSAEGKP
jgi:hypothetical protein